MIKVSVKFFTDNLPKSSKVDDKTAWGVGVITLPKNTSRGIEPDLIIFNSTEELLPKMQELLDRNSIKLVRPTKKVEMTKLT